MMTNNKIVFKQYDRIKIPETNAVGEIILVVDDEMHILWDDETDDDVDDFRDKWSQVHLNKRRNVYPISGFVASSALRIIYHLHDKYEPELKVSFCHDGQSVFLIIKFPEDSSSIHISPNCIGFENKRNISHISKDSSDFYHAFIMLGIGRLIEKELTFDEFVDELCETRKFVKNVIDIDFPKHSLTKIWKIGQYYQTKTAYESYVPLIVTK